MGNQAMTDSPTWLFVHSSDELYGADRVLLDIMRALPDAIRETAIVWLPSDLDHGEYLLCEELDAMGVRNHHVPLPILRRANLTAIGMSTLTRRAAAFRSAIRTLKPAVVYGTTSATLPALSAIADAKCRRILHNQEIWKPQEGSLLGQFARCAERIIAISEATKAAEPDYLQQRTIVVPNTTVDQQTLPTYRQLSSLPTDPIEFLAAGRWTANKGLDVLVDAWGLAAPGRLTIAGGPPPSGESLDLTKQVADNKNAASINLVGEVESISPLINASHVVVMPSTWPEPFGLVALEAMSAGRPVVATRVGGLQQFVTPEVGWLVDPNDPSGLAQTLATITHEQVLDKGQRAREHYERNFSQAQFKRNWRAAVGLPD